MIASLACGRCAMLDGVVSTAPVSALTADKWVLQRGSTYRAVLQFVMWDAAEAWTTLQDLGFRNVKIYRDASELPPDWPVSYDDPYKDASPGIDTIIVRGELAWPGDDKSINRRIALSTGPAIVLKAWRLGTAPDPKVDPKPEPNPPGPEPIDPPAPPPAPHGDTLGIAAKVAIGVTAGVVVLGGIVTAIVLAGKR